MFNATQQFFLLNSKIIFLKSAQNEAEMGPFFQRCPNKNDSIQSKNIPALKLPRFFTRRMGDENFFSTEWRFSYIVLGHTKDKDGST